MKNTKTTQKFNKNSTKTHKNISNQQKQTKIMKIHQKIIILYDYYVYIQFMQIFLTNFVITLSTKMATSIVRVLAAYPKRRKRAGKTMDAAFTTICATSPQLKRETN